MATKTTGVPTLDTFLGGGMLAGDNVVWIGDEGDAVRWFCWRLLDGGPRPGRLVTFGGAATRPDPPPGIDVLDLSDASGVGTPAAARAAILALDHDEGSRLVFDGIDDLVRRWGAPAARELYTTVCPRLFELGAVAYWTGTREWVSAGLLDDITRVAQCVFDLRDQRLRVAKAEGRPQRIQGSLVELLPSSDAGGPIGFEVGREHVVGRVGAGLRRVRQARNLTQTQLAALAGVSPAAISQTESGRRGLSLDTLVPLCDRLGIGVDDLLGAPDTQDVVLARRDRLRISEGVVALHDDPSAGLRTYLIRLDVGESKPPPFTHKGVETVLVGDGLILVDTGDETPVLRTGDAVLVRRAVIERWTNLGDRPAQFFWIV
jgi:transcriptional regulator with XRE-family HTH domain